MGCSARVLSLFQSDLKLLHSLIDTAHLPAGNTHMIVEIGECPASNIACLQFFKNFLESINLPGGDLAKAFHLDGLVRFQFCSQVKNDSPPFPGRGHALWSIPAG